MEEYCRIDDPSSISFFTTPSTSILVSDPAFSFSTIDEVSFTAPEDSLLLNSPLCVVPLASNVLAYNTAEAIRYREHNSIQRSLSNLSASQWSQEQCFDTSSILCKATPGPPSSSPGYNESSENLPTNGNTELDQGCISHFLITKSPPMSGVSSPENQNDDQSLTFPSSGGFDPVEPNSSIRVVPVLRDGDIRTPTLTSHLKPSLIKSSFGSYEESMSALPPPHPASAFLNHMPFRSFGRSLDVTDDNSLHKVPFSLSYMYGLLGEMTSTSCEHHSVCSREESVFSPYVELKSPSQLSQPLPNYDFFSSTAKEKKHLDSDLQEDHNDNIKSEKAIISNKEQQNEDRPFQNLSSINPDEPHSTGEENISVASKNDESTEKENDISLMNKSPVYLAGPSPQLASEELTAESETTENELNEAKRFEVGKWFQKREELDTCTDILASSSTDDDAKSIYELPNKEKEISPCVTGLSVVESRNVDKERQESERMEECSDDFNAVWHEGFRLPLGKDGRGELIKQMRSVHKTDREFCRCTLEEMGIDFKRLAHATVKDLWKIAYRWGLFDYAVKLSRKYGKGVNTSPSKRKASTSARRRFSTKILRL